MALLDPIKWLLTAQPLIRGTQFHIFLRADLDERELSILLYHEVLAAATLAAAFPPEAVIEFNKGNFEEATQSAQERFGIASPRTLNQLFGEHNNSPYQS